MFIYRAASFDQEVQHQSNLSSQIDRLCDDLAQMSVEQVQSRFERIYPFLKRKEGNLRLIARIYRVDRMPILCWLKVFSRGDRAYEDFLRDRENYGHQSWASDVEESRLRQWLQQQQTPERDSASPPLPSHLYPWLDRPAWAIDNDRLLIYESPTWVEEFQRPAVYQHWEQYNRLILDLADQRNTLGLLYSQSGVRLHGEGKHFLLYAHLLTQDEHPREILFLLSPFCQRPAESEINRIIHQHEIDFTQPLSVDDLSNWTQRAYPVELIVSEESWLAIENQASTNLALSTEEEAILHSVSTASPSLPLFLNGQAGSGKSTLLFHLFADYCDRHFSLCEQQQQETNQTPHPLFLAYNDRLLRVAQEQVATLLNYHHRFAEDQRFSDPLPKIRPFFKTFSNFLRHLLPSHERQHFAPEKYISFHRFRELCRRHLPRYSPEKCWLVIRTFIKGYHLDERENYLTIEDYLEIPNKEKVISEEEFIDIYNQVWTWYNTYTQEQGEWDDQDLIRCVLHHQYYSPDYTAIFCDEAQDFTRLELQLIMRLSVFSQYDLEHEYVPSLPFAFAGDPLQTLNPTGFRWASLKATFYNEVLTVLSPTGNLKLEMNFQELVCNYRSFPAIVGVNNLIQLWRKQLFHLPEIQPQMARKIGDRIPEKFILGQNLSLEDAKFYLRNALIILPCDEAGEKDYIQQDELLKELSVVGVKENQPWNMLSSIAAKGLEFKQVILYKFGDYCPGKLFETNSKADEKVKYFLNKLYVAVSRATEQLLIVDTVRGEEELWKYASDEATLLRLIGQEKKWENKIHKIAWGDAPEKLGKDDPSVLAETLMREGLNTKNPDLLRRASQAYQRLEKQEKAKMCEGKALKLEGEFIAAGNCFLSQNDFEEAWDCFWHGMGWKELKQLNQFLEENARAMSEEYSPLIDYMATVKTNEKQPNLSQINEFSAFLLSSVNHEQLWEENSLQWETSIETYTQQIKQLLNQTEGDKNIPWETYGEVLEKLGKQRKPELLRLAGDCYFSHENYAKATTCWEESQDTSQPKYYQAKAYVLGMPQGLEYLVRLGENQEIVKAWKKANQPFKKEWLVYVAPVLEANGDYELALRSNCYLNKKDRVQFCLNNLPVVTDQSIRLLIIYYLYFQHWEEMTITLETYLPQLIKQGKENLSFIITKIAESSLTPERITLQQRQRLEKLFKTKILSYSGSKKLPIYHLGITLEKLGLLVESLKFYERYLNKQTPSNLRNFSRQRWLATKKKQALYFKKQGRTDRANQLEKELNHRAMIWKINLKKIMINPPKIATTQSPLPEKKANVKPWLKVPANTKIQSSSQGILQLQLRHLQIKIIQKEKQLLIIDLLTRQTFRIDGLTHQIMIGETILKPQGEQSLSFMSPRGNFAGNVVYAEGKCQIELHIQGLSEKIQIVL